MVGVDPERALGVVDDEVGGHREERSAGRFVWVKVPGLVHIGHVARRADFDHPGLFHPVAERMPAHWHERPDGIHPAQPVARAFKIILRMIDRHADEIVLRRVAQIDKVIVDREPPFFDDRAHLGQTGVLVPPAALMKPGEGDEREQEKKDFEAGDAGHARA